MASRVVITIGDALPLARAVAEHAHHVVEGLFTAVVFAFRRARGQHRARGQQRLALLLVHTTWRVDFFSYEIFHWLLRRPLLLVDIFRIDGDGDC